MNPEGYYTVLFVDDEPSILRALARLFHGDPINVFTASNAEEALQIISRDTVHLLVTDNIMPGLSGVELAKRCRSVSPDTFRILLSGHSDMEAVLAALNEGEAYRFILKPWNDADLKAAVNVALAHRRLLDDNRRLVSELQVKNRMLDQIVSRFPEVLQKSELGSIRNDGTERKVSVS